MRKCLRRVLELEPDNTAAMRGLVELSPKSETSSQREAQQPKSSRDTASEGADPGSSSAAEALEMTAKGTIG